MTALAARTTGWFTTDDCRLDDFRAVVETTTGLADYPSADEGRENVPVYGPGLGEHVATPEGRRDVQAQVAHRDYHLGVMSGQQALAYPAHVHRLSPVPTLQGAVAHCDRPVVTGQGPRGRAVRPGGAAHQRTVTVLAAG